MNAAKIFWIGILLGAGIGGLGAAAVTLHICASKVDDGTARIDVALQQTKDQYQENLDLATQEIAMWQKRASACEAKLPAGKREPIAIPRQRFVEAGK